MANERLQQICAIIDQLLERKPKGDVVKVPLPNEPDRTVLARLYLKQYMQNIMLTGLETIYLLK